MTDTAYGPDVRIAVHGGGEGGGETGVGLGVGRGGRKGGWERRTPPTGRT